MSRLQSCAEFGAMFFQYLQWQVLQMLFLCLLNFDFWYSCFLFYCCCSLIFFFKLTFAMQRLTILEAHSAYWSMVACCSKSCVNSLKSGSKSESSENLLSNVTKMSKQVKPDKLVLCTYVRWLVRSPPQPLDWMSIEPGERCLRSQFVSSRWAFAIQALHCVKLFVRPGNEIENHELKMYWTEYRKKTWFRRLTQKCVQNVNWTGKVLKL